MVSSSKNPSNLKTSQNSSTIPTISTSNQKPKTKRNHQKKNTNKSSSLENPNKKKMFLKKRKRTTNPVPSLSSTNSTKESSIKTKLFGTTRSTKTLLALCHRTTWTKWYFTSLCSKIPGWPLELWTSLSNSERLER